MVKAEVIVREDGAQRALALSSVVIDRPTSAARWSRAPEVIDAVAVRILRAQEERVGLGHRAVGRRGAAEGAGGQARLAAAAGLGLPDAQMRSCTSSPPNSRPRSSSRCRCHRGGDVELHQVDVLGRARRSASSPGVVDHVFVGHPLESQNSCTGRCHAEERAAPAPWCRRAGSRRRPQSDHAPADSARPPCCILMSSWMSAAL